MKFEASPESCLAFATASVVLVGSWPPNSKATRVSDDKISNSIVDHIFSTVHVIVTTD